MYSYNFDMVDPQVSVPPVTHNHDPDCALPLCPVRVKRENELHAGVEDMECDDGRYTEVTPRSGFAAGRSPLLDGGMAPFLDMEGLVQHGMKVEEYGLGQPSPKFENEQLFYDSDPQDEAVGPYHRAIDEHITTAMKEEWTPVAYEPAQSSSPRDLITNVRLSQGKRPTFKKNSRYANSLQLPQLTGAARERFKIQRERIERWQVANNIRPDDPETKRANNRALKLQIREEMRQKKMRDKSVRDVENGQAPKNLRSGSVLENKSNDIENLAGSNRISRNLRRSRRLQKLESRNKSATTTVAETDTETDTETELNQETHSPVSAFLKFVPVFDPRVAKEGERLQQQIEQDATKNFNGTGTPYLNTAPAGNVPVTWSTQMQQSEKQTFNRDLPKAPIRHASRRRIVKVDYELPEGKARLEWDTDLVRRLFGEIE